jgi:hypothetical protein
MFNINQIVAGKNAGVFVVLAHRTIGGEAGCQVKPVNPANHAQHGVGEFFLPNDALRVL